MAGRASRWFLAVSKQSTSPLAQSNDRLRARHNARVSSQPDYLPEETLAWAAEHSELMELIVEELLGTGAWPTSTALSRDLARQGRPVPLSSIAREMPKPLGFLENQDSRIVLLLFGLRLTSAGQVLLDGFYELLATARERYGGEQEAPSITRADVTGEHAAALSEIVLREGPFLGSGTGGPEEDWRREITEAITRYWDVQSPEDYLRTRARELRMSPQFGFDPKPTQPQGGTRDVFISHASEDSDAIARPLADALRSAGLTVWFDEQELVLGDSLRERIEEGVAQSTLGVVILSHAFFSKRWPQHELNALYARLVGGEDNVIVPIWHHLSREELTSYAPALADILAGDSSDGTQKLTEQIQRTLARRPPLSATTPSVPLAHEHVPSARLADRSALHVSTELAFQATIGVHRPPSSRIRWTPVFQLLYTGSRILTILDIIPMGPTQIAEDGRPVTFLRTARSSKYRAYDTFGALAEAQEENAETDLRHVEEWPLVLMPGQRLRVAVEHEYAIQLGDEPVTFDSDEDTLPWLAAYFHLESIDDGYKPSSVLLPTRIVCTDDVWEINVPYLILPVGSTILLPSEEEIEEADERDDLA
jgi:hypothetical protein